MKAKRKFSYVYEIIVSFFVKAIIQAQNMGIAEADPTNDLEGWDTAAKLLIIMHSMGIHKGLGDVK